MMTVWERVQLGLQSEVGVLMLGLLSILAVLCVVYSILAVRKRSRDHLAYMFNTYYEEADRCLKNITLESTHRVGFFGRETVCRLADGACGLCRVPPPDLVDAAARERFRAFRRAYGNRGISPFTSFLWTYEKQVLITVQGKMIHKTGQPMMGAREYLYDKSLTQAEVEDLLLHLAKGLAALHSKKTEGGRPLYHGFLLPRSLYLDYSKVKKNATFAVADIGMAYTLGPSALYERLQLLKNDQLPIETVAGDDLINQFHMLAPEQRDSSRFSEVGPASDFFSYAALAVTLFTKKSFSGIESVRWGMVPEKWREFLKSALSDVSASRPKEFLELEDWLTDPELALTYSEPMETTGDVTSNRATSAAHAIEEAPKLPLSALSGVLERVQKNKNIQFATSTYEAGEELIENGQWKEAENVYITLLTSSPEDPKALLGLAIAYYEQGMLEESEKIFEKAEQIDPSTPRKFRDYLTFRV